MWKGPNPLLLALKVKEGAISQRTQAVSRSYQRQGNESSSRDSKGMQPQHFDFSPVRPCQSSDIQNWKMLNLCCCKPPSLLKQRQKKHKHVLSSKRAAILSLFSPLDIFIFVGTCSCANMNTESCGYIFGFPWRHFFNKYILHSKYSYQNGRCP